MYKSLLVLLLISKSLFAQDLQSFLNTATFFTDNKSYVETYLSFNSNTLKLIEHNDHYKGFVNVLIEISSNDKTVFQDNYLLESPEFKYKNNNNIFFIDQQRIYLDNGSYNVSIDLFDVNNKKVVNHNSVFTINYNDKITLSDIQLIEKYTLKSDYSIKVKNKFSLDPYVSNFFPKNIDKINLYIEAYNILNFDNYKLKTYIEKYQEDQYLNFKVKNSIIKSSNLINIDITDLYTGNYNLVCEIIDLDDNVVNQKKIFFQRSKNDNSEDNLNFDNIFINNIDSLRLYIDYLYPIATPLENSFLHNQLSYNDIFLMQKFLYNFWKDRNKINPILAWNNYHNEVKKVNNSFNSAGTKGYLTDRGRVYLKYGAPNSRNKVDNSSANYPYEIWHYYKLNNQSNRKFIFVNSDFATNHYKLEYSNVLGEVTNSEWMNKIEYQKNPTFVDDINDNYINPR